MTRTQLDTPFLDGGIRSTNFFNGRLLSREDMQREQDAERAVHERLGRALGAGIAYGLEVEAKAIGGNSAADPVVTVHAGLAINRRGQTVALDRDVDVSLLKPAAPATSTTSAAGAFATCLPPDNAVYVTGTGVYLLAVAPASQKQGLAVVSGLNNTAAACNAKEVVAGVQFHLTQVKLTSAELADDAHLRNAVAYKFFAAEGAGTDAVRDPFGVPPSPVALTDPPLSDCDVPLGVFQWTAAGGLRWVDLWSVRRRPAGPDSDAWPMFPGARPDAVGEAMLRQFQHHIGSLRDASALPTRASDVFRSLPPAGLVPLGGIAGAVGVDAARFFDGFTTRGPVFVEGARVPAFLRLATRFPPIRVGDPELVWLYLVRENRQPVAGVVPRQPYLIFALGRLPYQAAPRFDVSHWDFANYALDDERMSP
ncbi:MAG TPA: hypothetical protein VF516_44475 [Kofleriaceae bacterium]